MILGIAGSRSLSHPLPDDIMPPYIDQIISGGAKGIDRCARNYAKEHHIQILEILPEYDIYGRSAPLRRNDWIIELSDMVLIFWDGKSRGSNYMIEICRKQKKPMKLFQFEGGEFRLIEEIPYLPELPETFFENFVPTVIYE